jgi:hypothetical protein
MVSGCGPGVIVAGSEHPAMSVMYADARGGFSGYSVIFSELDPEKEGPALTGPSFAIRFLPSV